MHDAEAAPPVEYASLPRRLAAGFYDLFPLAAVLMAATALLFPLTRERIAPGTLWYQLYLAAIAFLYYGVSWRRGGQSIGMKAWRLRVVREDGGALSWRDVAVRSAVGVVACAAAGLGLLAALLDPRRRMWHDRAARTVVLLEPKKGTRTINRN